MIIVNSGIASAQQGGSIGVDNDGPSFLDISIDEDDNYIYVRAEVRDLNGWADLFAVNVTVFDSQDRIISRVNYMQYASLSSSTSVVSQIWNQTNGDYLQQSQSTADPFDVPPWNPDNAILPIGLRLSFAYAKFSGETIRITAMDLGEMVCAYEGPFSADYTPAPTFEGMTIPVSLSTVFAVIGALIMVARRSKNNKLARAAENTARGGEE